MSRDVFGVFEDGEVLVGAAIFGRPSGRLVAGSLWSGGDQANTSELTRLFVDDSTGANIESWFLARCLRALPQQVELVVAYSAPDAHHHGGCYQASNWLYLGRGTGQCHYHYVDRDGQYVNKRKPWDVYDRDRDRFSSERAAAEALGLTKVTEQPKHVYVYPRTRRARRSLLREVLPYPKPDRV